MAGLEKDTAGDMEVCTVVVAETCIIFQKDVAGDIEGMHGSGCRNLQQVPEGYGRWGRRGHRFPGMFNHGFQGRMYGGSGMG